MSDCYKSLNKRKMQSHEDKKEFSDFSKKWMR